MITLMLTGFAAVSLFLPGMGLLQIISKDIGANTKLILAPVVSILIFAAGGWFGWMLPEYFGIISWFVVCTACLAGSVAFFGTGGLATLRQIDLVIPSCYGFLIFFATQFALLPVRLPVERFPQLPYTYFVHRPLLPVRIQALYQDLPVDNLIPFRFADFMLHGVDFRQPREFGCENAPAIAPGQQIMARTPLMSLVSVHAIAMIGPKIAVDGKWEILAKLQSDAAYTPFWVVAVCLNGLIVFPAYLLGTHFGGKTVGRLALILVAANFGILLHTNFIWPKALGGYFAGLLLFAFLQGSSGPMVTGLFAALAYLSHPCAVGAIAAYCIYHFIAEKERRAAFVRLLQTGAWAAAIITPWLLWGNLWLHSSGNLIAQNLKTGKIGEAAAVRVGNIENSLIPHFLWAEESWSRRLFQSSFFTIPGMLGLSLLPLLTISFLGWRRLALGSISIVIPVFLTALPFGELHGGLAPFGAFLTVPVLIAVALVPLGSVGGLRRSGFVISCLLEQIFVVWCVYSPHAAQISMHGNQVIIRLIGLVFLQSCMVVLAIHTCLSSGSQRMRSFNRCDKNGFSDSEKTDISFAA